MIEPFIKYSCLFAVDKFLNPVPKDFDLASESCTKKKKYKNILSGEKKKKLHVYLRFRIVTHLERSKLKFGFLVIRFRTQ